MDSFRESAAIEETDSELLAAVRRAQAAWPGLRVDATAFARHLRERRRLAVQEGFNPALLHCEDLYLAWACAQGSGPARQAFYDVHMGALARHLRALPGGDIQAAEIDDVVHAVYLLVVFGATGQAPTMTKYKGHRPLRVFLRYAASWYLSNQHRRWRNRRQPLPEELERCAAEPGSGRDLLAEQQVALMKTALAETVADLPSQDRLLVQQRYLEGVPVAEIARRDRVARTTVHRRLLAACQAIKAGVLRRMKATLGLRDDELDHIWAANESRLEQSIRRLLKKD